MHTKEKTTNKRIKPYRYKLKEKEINELCIKGESNPRRVDGNDPGYHYPINARGSYSQYII